MINKIKNKIRIFIDEARLELSIIEDKLKDPVILKSVFKLFLFLIGIFFIAEIILYLFTTKNDINSIISSSKFLGPIIIIILIGIEVVVAPLPGFVVMVTSGYVFGPILGSLYSYLGNIFGSVLAFLLVKKYGRPFTKKIISHKLFNSFDHMFKKFENNLIFLYMIPIAPVDIISLMAGLSKIKLKKFLKIIIIGFIPNVVLFTFFGNYLTKLSILTSIIYFILFILVFGFLSWLFKWIYSQLSFNEKIKKK